MDPDWQRAGFFKAIMTIKDANIHCWQKDMSEFSIKVNPEIFVNGDNELIRVVIVDALVLPEPVFFMVAAQAEPEDLIKTAEAVFKESSLKVC